MPRFLSLVCVVLLFAAAPCRALDWGSQELETEKIAIKLTREVLKGGYQIVRADELKRWYDEKKPMLVVDTMPLADSYAKQHLPGAVQFEFPIEELTVMDPARQAAYEKLLGSDKGRLIVVYCGFTKCGRSHNGAVWAQKLGYTNVVRYPGGIKAWEQADYPVEKGN